MPLCSVSVDLDEIPNYYAIHGLTPGHSQATAVYDVALGRFADLARDLELPLTLFAVGADMARPLAASGLRRMAEQGHEIGNHTLDHAYDLTRRSVAAQTEQVRGAADVLERATGQRPTGFRAPGYTVSDELYAVLQAEGVGYSSSVFPCPAYFAAKTGAISLIRLRGKQSHSVVDTPRVLTAPTAPYRVGRPYWTQGEGLLELPIQVTQRLRLPFIGTFLTMAGVRGAEWLTRGVLGVPFVNLELHGIDLLEAADGLQDLAKEQRDLRVPLSTKLAVFSAVVRMLRRFGYTFVRLDEAAKQCRART